MNKPGKIFSAIFAGIIIFSAGGFIAFLRSNNSNAEETIVISQEGEINEQRTVDEETTENKNTVPTINEPAKSTKVALTTKPSGSKTTKNNYEYSYAGFNPEPAVIDSAKWNLLLVNRNFILPEDFTVTLANVAPGYDTQMDARAAGYYTKMFNAAKEEDITLVPISGHRRISTQKTNFENKIKYYLNEGDDKVTATQKAAQSILPPGCSEHNAGLAMDLCQINEVFENTSEFKWLLKNAAEYGFILRYPKDKTKITEIIYEPWHWRYVGVEAAQSMQESGQCLEEYLGKVY